MTEIPFEVPIASGVLHGHRAEGGPPALLLHGGAAVSDYMEGCAAELAGLFSTMRYTQRGTPPSTGRPPYTIETYMADAVAVLDAFEVDRAWAIGHSWGGQLALHLLVARPERLLGVICIDPLEAIPSAFPEYDRNVRQGLDDRDVERLEEVEAARRRSEATEADLVERLAIIWPVFFAAGGAAALPPPACVGVRASTETNVSISDHFARGTLGQGLPSARLPALFVHGEADPMPVAATVETAALIPGARVEVLVKCGHFPWVERPGRLRGIVEGFLGGPGR